MARPRPPAAPNTSATRSLTPSSIVKTPMHWVTTSTASLLPPPALHGFISLSNETCGQSEHRICSPMAIADDVHGAISATAGDSLLLRRPIAKSAASRGTRASSRTRAISDSRRLNPGPGSGKQTKFRASSPDSKMQRESREIAHDSPVATVAETAKGVSYSYDRRS